MLIKQNSEDSAMENNFLSTFGKNQNYVGKDLTSTGTAFDPSEFSVNKGGSNNPLDFGNSGGNNTQKAGGFWSNAGSILQGIGGAASAYAGLKSIDLGKDQLAWGKQTYGDNFGAQRALSNEALLSQQTARGINDRGLSHEESVAQARQYVADNGVQASTVNA